MRRYTRAIGAAFLASLLAGLGVSAGTAAEKLEKCFLWKVPSKTATVYLLGSIHVSSEKMYPLDPAIEEAYAESDALVVEINPGENPMEVAVKMAQRAAYPGGVTLEADLSKKALEKLRAVLEERGMSLAQVNRMRPWYLGLMLVMGELKRLGYGEKGVDFHFIGKAAARKKEILELETAEDQIEVLGGGTKEEQELALVDTLERLPDIKGMMEKMIDAWLAGDVEGFNRLVKENLSKDPRMKPYYRRLFDERNVRMADKIEEFLKTGRTYFVVIGSGHLVGGNGVVGLLRDKGYAPVQVEKAAGKGGRKPGRPRDRAAPPRTGAPEPTRAFIR